MHACQNMHHTPNLNFFPRPAVSVVLLVLTTATAVAPTFSCRCDGCSRTCVRVSEHMSCSDGCDRGRLAHLCACGTAMHMHRQTFHHGITMHLTQTHSNIEHSHTNTLTHSRSKRQHSARTSNQNTGQAEVCILPLAASGGSAPRPERPRLARAAPSLSTICDRNCTVHAV
jgi:hypothetical protein